MAAVDDATNELFDKIDKREMKLTPKQITTVQDAVNVHLAKTSTREEIRKELAALGETLVGIEKDFDDIRYEVERINKLGILRDGATHVARWIELHDVSEFFLN
ncbi:hypothetical protein BJ165DRAFT_652308 [Panaeolus papilionaceus]|nr:hypothetical protein BJ165DRAFT_652308 [Panaeolus papilionaceus]